MGKGALGLTIRALNWVRWKLETFVQRLVLRCLGRDASLPKERMRELVRSFQVDVHAEQVEKEATSPLYPGMYRQEDFTVPPRSARYATESGIPSSALAESVAETQNQLPTRPKSLDNLVGMFAVKGRHQRYTRSPVLSVEEFEPLGSESTED